MTVAMISKLAETKKREQGELGAQIIDLALAALRDGSAPAGRVIAAALEGLDPSEVPDALMQQVIAARADAGALSSFRALLTVRRRQFQLGPFKTERYVDTKDGGRDFARACGVPVPQLIRDDLTIGDIRPEPGFVYKPVSSTGGNGVILFFAHDRIYLPKPKIWASSWKEALKDVRKRMRSGAVKLDRWIQEELVGDVADPLLPARDLKFYMFYGKTGLVLETTRFGAVRRCWWNGAREIVRTGKYEDAAFAGLGYTREQEEMAMRISSEIPAPFMRVDFLNGARGAVFGEMGAKPGHYEAFDDATDRALGDLFLEADGRLTADLLAGKDFARWKAAASAFETRPDRAV